MKKTMLIAGLMTLLGFTSQAQNIPARPNNGVQKERRMDRQDMYKGLNLTTKQQDQLKTLNEDMRSQRKAIMDDNTLTTEQRKTKMQALRDDQRTKMDAILTPEQRTQWNNRTREWRNDNNQERNNRDSGRNGFQRNNNFQKDELNLNNEQKTKMKTLNDDLRTQVQSIRDDNNLTQEQKKAKLQALRDDQMAKRKAILTKEQYSKWEENMKGDKK